MTPENTHITKRKKRPVCKTCLARFKREDAWKEKQVQKKKELLLHALRKKLGV